MTPSHASIIERANAALLVEGDVSGVGSFFTEDYVAHTTARDLTGGPRGVRRFVDMLRKSFSGLQVDVQIMVESGDRVAWQRTIRATHKKAFMGFPATGTGIVWRDMLTSRFENGRIAEEWAVSDLAEALLLARKS